MFETLEHVTAQNFPLMSKLPRPRPHYLSATVLAERSTYTYFIEIKYVDLGAGYMRQHQCLFGSLGRGRL
jgi:hypothetical protein